MNIENLIEEQSKFEPYLKDTDYTFIGPVDQNLFEPFMKNANLIAPIKGYSRKIKDFMSDKSAVSTALALLPIGTELRIYVIIDKSEDILFHSTIEEYCERMKITYP
ncbi:hypothetical protein SAMN05421789_104217 [Kaistella chaponensis]|uniref:Uncharacterized protein n=1 Tax=Kaistella chaponensis TaxID=713588 RepID=A0A1N7L4S1_9FLAO|nr:hypothetical protein [Kaistella chaponensis]SIS68781.1 hypothetical protein SAMN05421789_104217 [Kaistella chaponensis]